MRNIVTSIALIPDPIKRSVYIQEASSLLKIPEQVLLSELNKFLIQERRKNEKEKFREQEDSRVEVLQTEETATQEIDAQSMVYYQERETIRLLLNYADDKLEDQSLSNFLLHELEDVEFTNPVFQTITEIAKLFDIGYLLLSLFIKYMYFIYITKRTS